jgi:cysteine-rich repeat protein
MIRRPSSAAAALALVFLLSLALASLSGCGGSSDPAFANCGNGVVDAGEECDDGNLFDDDDCLSTCVVARCGDAFAAGLAASHFEECDGIAFPSICSSSLPAVVFCRQNTDCPPVPSRTPVCNAVSSGGVASCSSLNLGAGPLSCSNACRRDTSACMAFTPTATATVGPPPPPTPTRTPRG